MAKAEVDGLMEAILCPFIVVAGLVFARWAFERARRFLRGEHLFPPIFPGAISKVTLHYGSETLVLDAVVLKSIDRECTPYGQHVYDRYVFHAHSPVALPLE